MRTSAPASTKAPDPAQAAPPAPSITTGRPATSRSGACSFRPRIKPTPSELSANTRPFSNCRILAEDVSRAAAVA